MNKLGFYYDASRCSGCRACQIACKDRNNLPVGTLYRHVRSYEVGSYPMVAIYNYSHTCNHCEKPACVASCPTRAMYIDEDTTVQHDDDLCIGCGSCVMSCPYHVPVLLDESRIAGKCDACKPLRDAGHNPVCVDACCMRALDFGDVDELKAKYGPDLVQDIEILPSSDETHPATQLKVKASMTEPSPREIVV